MLTGRLVNVGFAIFLNTVGCRSFTVRPTTSSTVVVVCPEEEETVATTGLYVHIPFCRRRCRYCDFAIVPIGNASPSSSKDDSRQHKNILFGKYQNAITQEILSLDTRRDSENNTKVTLDTIYFGGGTPSLAPLSMIQAIVQSIHQSFDLADELEFTMECDPGKEDKAVYPCAHLCTN